MAGGGREPSNVLPVDERSPARLPLGGRDRRDGAAAEEREVLPARPSGLREDELLAGRGLLG